MKLEYRFVIRYEKTPFVVKKSGLYYRSPRRKIGVCWQFLGKVYIFKQKIFKYLLTLKLTNNVTVIYFRTSSYFGAWGSVVVKALRY